MPDDARRHQAATACSRWTTVDDTPANLIRDDEVELDPGERLVDAALADFVRIDALNRRNEFVPGSESDVVVEILIPRDVDLCVARRPFNEATSWGVVGSRSLASELCLDLAGF